MARLNRPTSGSQNPATKRITWKSNEKAFEVYDVESGNKTLQEPPLKFLFLEHYHTIEGWHDASDSGIYSNEVFLSTKEELTVKAKKGGEIASGLYGNIKSKVIQLGGKYHRSIYVMFEDGTMGRIRLKGAAVKSYSEFYNDNNHLLDNQWVEVNEFENGKKGAVKYTTPVFSIGDHITDEIDAKANEVANTLQDYMDNQNDQEQEDVSDVDVRDAEPVWADADLDDIDV